MFVGIDAHKRFHVAALVDETGIDLGGLSFANEPAGFAQFWGWLQTHAAEQAVIGVEGAGHYARALCGWLAERGAAVRDVPPWRTRRERRTQGPGKSDPADAAAIAQIVRTAHDRLGPAGEPELVRVIRLLELARRQAVRDRTQLIQRARSLWTQLDPAAEAQVAAFHRAKVIRRLRRISFGDGIAARTAARCLRDLAADIERLNRRIAELDREIADLIEKVGNPLVDLHGAGTTVAAMLIAQAGDVRRFRSAAAFARYAGTAPIPCGSGESSGRHRLYRGGNRQLNTAIYRIALVQARDDPTAQRYLARKQAEGKTKREARRALCRHLTNVVYRRLLAWAETSLGAHIA